MLTSSIPLDVKIFITETIETVSHLEVLLMLFNNFDLEWDEISLSREMRSNTSIARSHLLKLKDKKLLSENNHKYKYDPLNPKHKLVQELNQIYSEKPVAVIACIFEKPDKLKDLSDAFKLKKD